MTRDEIRKEIKAVLKGMNLHLGMKLEGYQPAAAPETSDE